MNSNHKGYQFYLYLVQLSRESSFSFHLASFPLLLYSYVTNSICRNYCRMQSMNNSNILLPTGSRDILGSSFQEKIFQQLAFYSFKRKDKRRRAQTLVLQTIAIYFHWVCALVQGSWKALHLVSAGITNVPMASSLAD